jgi:hypothetical protein
MSGGISRRGREVGGWESGFVMGRQKGEKKRDATSVLLLLLLVKTSGGWGDPRREEVGYGAFGKCMNSFFLTLMILRDLAIVMIPIPTRIPT